MTLTRSSFSTMFSRFRMTLQVRGWSPNAGVAIVLDLFTKFQPAAYVVSEYPDRCPLGKVTIDQ